ncbi:TPA: hypothetical protein NJ359_004520 [Vibrio parahaemolyticus]|nr:hypothetical protein [Vibrio parahaemolyticus]HCG7288927.1 hypothetical protein [Vibrio parahaemolyticus]
MKQVKDILTWTLNVEDIDSIADNLDQCTYRDTDKRVEGGDFYIQKNANEKAVVEKVSKDAA